MRLQYLVYLSILVSLHGVAQSLELKGQNYTATDSWAFLCENYALSGIAEIQIAKVEKGGILKLNIETTNPKFTISGMVYVFLADNTIITCSDKGLHEISGNKIGSYYMFSAVEMNKLRHTEIQSIHFNITGKANEFSSQIGNFTALNRRKYFSTEFDKSKKSYATAEAINALYK